MSFNVLPHMVPEDGERYDMTLDRIGVHKNVHVARWIIDNGQYCGKKVSGKVDIDLFNIVYAVVLDNLTEEIPTGWNEPKFVIAANNLARKIRVSAQVKVYRQAVVNDEMILVDAEYQESNVKVTYDVTHYSDPDGESTLTSRFRFN